MSNHSQDEVESGEEPIENTLPNFDISISGAEKIDDFIVYDIRIVTPRVKWVVRRRYKEFYDLNKSLLQIPSARDAIKDKFLPAKRILGNQSSKFIAKRQEELEKYLRSICNAFTVIPAEFAHFLEFEKYELNWILHSLSRHYHRVGEAILSSKKSLVTLFLLQLHAIYERMKLTLQPDASEFLEPDYDLGHLLDVCFCLTILRIQGSKQRILSSDWLPHELTVDFTIFKSIAHLQLYNCNIAKFTPQSFPFLAERLVNLHCHMCISNIGDILCPSHSNIIPEWSNLTRLNLSKNNIEAIDESLSTATKLQYLDLSHNFITKIQNISKLSSLIEINLSHNLITSLENIHLEVGNIKILNVSCNRLFNLYGCTKLFSIEIIEAGSNRICELDDIQCITSLPYLEFLNLGNNPITTLLDYRTRVLELFGDRSQEITLDLIPTTQKESDTVSILVALRKARLVKQHLKDIKGVNATSLLANFSSNSINSRSKSLGSESRNDRLLTLREKAKEGSTESSSLSTEYFQENNLVKLVKSGLIMCLTESPEEVDWVNIFDNFMTTLSPDKYSLLKTLITTLNDQIVIRSDATRLLNFICDMEHVNSDALADLNQFCAELKNFFSMAQKLLDKGELDISKRHSVGSFYDRIQDEISSKYPSCLLWEHILSCNKNCAQIFSLSRGFMALCRADCTSFIDFFHKNIIRKSYEDEQLLHMIWCYASYEGCRNSLPTLSLLFLTNLNFYVLQDHAPAEQDLEVSISGEHKQFSSYNFPTLEEAMDSLFVGFTLPLNDVKYVIPGLTNQSFQILTMDEVLQLVIIASENREITGFIAKLSLICENFQLLQPINYDLVSQQMTSFCDKNSKVHNVSYVNLLLEAKFNDRYYKFSVVAFVDLTLYLLDTNCCQVNNVQTTQMDIVYSVEIGLISFCRVDSKHNAVCFNVKIDYSGEYDNSINILDSHFTEQRTSDNDLHSTDILSRVDLEFIRKQDLEHFIFLLSNQFADATGSPLKVIYNTD